MADDPGMELVRVSARYIGHTQGTAKLYDLEERLTTQAKACAEELCKVLSREGEEIDVWGDAIPEVIATLCDYFGGGLVVHKRRVRDG